jgi:hypothetical protein
MMNPKKNVMGYLEHHRHLKYVHCLITIIHYQSCFDVTSPQASLVTATAPNERHLAQKLDPSAPLIPLVVVSSPALYPRVVDECEVRTMFVL